MGAGFLYPLPKTHAQNHVTSLSQQSQQQDNDESLDPGLGKIGCIKCIKMYKPLPLTNSKIGFLNG